ncbi:hypothetical protein RFI_00560 [Reticulomyxa filosa]|uniref:DEAD/DEAH box helicase domain-containing protein n=1 Tax=Reticulomyxa filosa TaxID=46433 RepID=X6PDE4_RETFI|nr:hypothetical protein RFI_00560 [Reticulomyxa filosa]|eukprot:ETO36505.1 hypothetical protein RFI_00560 [Reticulomyxa filosa]
MRKCENWIDWFRFLCINTREERVEHFLKRALFEASQRGYVSTTRDIPEVSYVQLPPNIGTKIQKDKNGMFFPPDERQGRAQYSGSSMDTRTSYQGQITREGQADDTVSAERYSTGNRYDDRRRQERARDPRRGGRFHNRDQRGGYDSRRGYDEMKTREGRKPLRQVSEHAAMSYSPERVTQTAQLPIFLQSGLVAEGIETWKKVQEQGLPGLTLGEDSTVLSPAGSGKSTLLAIAALYRLYVRKDPSFVIIICGDESHCVYMNQFIRRMGKDVPDLNVRFYSERKSNIFKAASYGRNILIGTLCVIFLFFLKLYPHIETAI